MSQQGPRAGSHPCGLNIPASTSLAQQSWQKPAAAAPVSNFLDSDFPRLSDTIQHMSSSNSNASFRSRSSLNKNAGSSAAQVSCEMPVAAATGNSNSSFRSRSKDAGSSAAQISCEIPSAAATDIDFRIGSFARIPSEWRESFSAVVNLLLGQSDNSTWQRYMRSERFATRVAVGCNDTSR